MQYIIHTLFPFRPDRNWATITDIEPFTEGELKVIIDSLPTRKAPGPHNIPNKIFKLIYQSNLDIHTYV